MKNFIKNLLFPKKLTCIFCNDEIFTESAFSICKNCLTTLPFLESHYCHVCGRKVVGNGTVCDYCASNKYNFKLARSVFVYTKQMHNVIYKLKYDNGKYLSNYLSKILYNYYINCEELNNIDIIIPVPIYKTRLKKRGYNQSELLLKNFIETNKVNTHLVEKVKDTGSQTEKNFKERTSNLENAFEILDKTIVKGKNILIVDDILTTGSTINEISKILLKSGAKNCYGLTLCSTAFEYRK